MFRNSKKVIKKNYELKTENTKLKYDLEILNLRCNRYINIFNDINNIIYSNNYGRKQGKLEKIKEILKDIK